MRADRARTSNGSQGFVAVDGDGDGDGDGDTLAAAIADLAPEFGLTATSARPVRRTWVDTFDRRLRRAGWVLEHTTRDGATFLQLTRPDDGPVRTPAPDTTWPAFASALPAGLVRDRVAPVADIRALLRTGTLRSVERETRVLDADGKTVARLLLDVPSGQRSPSAPALLTVRPVRGYELEAGRVSARLAAAPGVAPWATMRTLDMEQTDATAVAPDEPPLTADLPAASAVALILRGFRLTLEDNVAGLVADIDTEFLHDFRVAVRRARSILKLAGDVLPEGAGGSLADELKWLGDLTSPTRDLDVYQLGLPAMTTQLTPSAAQDLGALRDHLAARRDIEWRKLVRGVRSKRFRAVLQQWRAMEDTVLGAAAPNDRMLRQPSGEDDVRGVETATRSDAKRGQRATRAAPVIRAADLAGRSVSEARRRVVRLGGKITPASPAEDLHTLRKRCKELRYLLEVFAPLHDRAAHKQALQVLKALQECLGDFQDSEVQADALRTFAVEMSAAGTAQPETLLAMGELAAGLHAEQQRARSAFEGTFAAFMQQPHQRAFDALQPGGRDVRSPRRRKGKAS